jgi:hypothetical protein
VKLLCKGVYEEDPPEAKEWSDGVMVRIGKNLLIIQDSNTPVLQGFMPTTSDLEPSV